MLVFFPSLTRKMLMKREHVNYLQWSAAVSLVCAIVGTISLSTDFWINGTAKAVKFNISDVQDSNINYGLFSGTLVRRILLITCIFNENICIWSCQQYNGLRKKEAISLFLGQETPFSCLVTTRSADYNYLNGLATKELFLSASVAATAIFFIILTIIIYYASFILILLNCFMSPAITFLNITGIYIITISAFSINLIALIIYGSYYNSWVKNNIGILDTIVGDYKSDANLGIFFVIFLVHPTIIILLKFRNNKLILQRKETVIVVAKSNKCVYCFWSKRNASFLLESRYPFYVAP
ncbi:Protein of unknown function [Cotesia congregata]|uniref:Uncharacterized protein n=1 Tax=Cotesia congregata TaxID=51543 RepID=A0A8J2EE28_COTCN|nr:Protein of unknown function [Cotesia congregata]